MSYLCNEHIKQYIMKTVNLDFLIQELQNLKDKDCTEIQFNGTLMCKQVGNAIIISTEKQI